VRLILERSRRIFKVCSSASRTSFLFALKVVASNPAGTALQQLKDVAYADKYRSLKQPISQAASKMRR